MEKEAIKLENCLNFMQSEDEEWITVDFLNLMTIPNSNHEIIIEGKS